MKVYCIRRKYCAMDTWYEDEDVFFPNKSICEMRFQHLQQKYKEDYKREDCTFAGYSISEKQICFIEDSTYLEILQNREDSNYEAFRNWELEDY
jgi:hypothetical protein